MSGKEGLKAVPKGVDDFKELRDGDYYYVDKTELISDITSDKSKVFLFTRPRRFGKSLNLSMLDAFFNTDYKENTWFDGLKISEHDEASEHKNAYPVIRIDMKYVSVDSYDDFLEEMNLLTSLLYSKYSVKEVVNHTSSKYADIFARGIDSKLNKAELKKSVLFLCQILKDCYGVKPLIFIDEYDAPINNSFNKKDHEKILDFLRYFYSSTLKGNDFMSFAVVTGVMQIAKESIFSGLNNLNMNNIFSTDFDERYGFTSNEVEEMCSYYGHPEKFREAKEWYDGYRFGNAEIYNPWSILSYIKSGFKAKAYWAGTSGNDIIDTLIESTDYETFNELQSLGEGRCVKKTLPISVSLKNMSKDRKTVYAVMAIAGYLNAVPDDDDSYSLSIPNQEMYRVFSEFLYNYLHQDAFDAFKDFFDGMEKTDTEKMKKGLDIIFSNNIPFILLSDEKSYQLILAAAAMGRLGRYIITMEEETGNGKADIIMKSNHPGNPNIIFELKKTKNDGADLEKLANDALDQIENRKYYRGMTGRVLLYGIAFYGKESKIKFRELVEPRTR